MKLLSHILLQVVLLIGLAFGGFFIFQNTHRLDINLGQNVFSDVPVWLALLIAFLLGFFVALGVSMNVKMIKKRM
jgi:uncharacterized protein YneF (UPF0154 family)